jgi:hypothetical protein
MKLKIKNEFLDEMIFCPFTKQNVLVRFISSDMYELYCNKGYSILFEEDKPKVIKKDKPSESYDLPE